MKIFSAFGQCIFSIETHFCLITCVASILKALTRHFRIEHTSLDENDCLNRTSDYFVLQITLIACLRPSGTLSIAASLSCRTMFLNTSIGGNQKNPKLAGAQTISNEDHVGVRCRTDVINEVPGDWTEGTQPSGLCSQDQYKDTPNWCTTSISFLRRATDFSVFL